MQKLPIEITYELKCSFEYDKKGEIANAEIITIKAPTNLNLKEVSIIDQEFNRVKSKGVELSQKNQNEIKQQETTKNKQETAEQTEITEQDIIEIMSVFDSDFMRCYDALRRILTSGSLKNPTAVLDNETQVTNLLFDKMSPIDTKCILGVYIKNFLFISQAV